MVGTEVLNVMYMNKTPAVMVIRLPLEITPSTIKHNNRKRPPSFYLVLLLLDGKVAEA
jgi:hypothetical protein